MSWSASAFGFVIAAAALCAQENAPPGLLRGDFLSWTGTARNGQFLFETGVNRIYSCSFDDKTYMEREGRRIEIAQKGEHLEIVSDRRPDSLVCYARLVHVLDPQRAYFAPGVRPHPKTSRLIEPFGPRGTLTLSGLVMSIKANILTLKSRAGEYATIHLRPDTRYSTGGQTAEAANLRNNTLVFVRCGRTVEDEVEAYHVIWGEILRPDE